MDLDEEIKSREEGEIGSESRKKGDLLPCSSPPLNKLCCCIGGKVKQIFFGLVIANDEGVRLETSAF